MLNSRLPESELQKSLSKYLNRIDFILNELDLSVRNITQNKSVMGQLHHALNIAEYANPAFRKNLLMYADPRDLAVFFGSIGIPYTLQPRSELIKRIKTVSRLPWGNNSYTKKFVEIFGYEQDLVPTSSVKRERITMIPKSENPFKPLTDYQSDIFFRGSSTASIPWSRFVIHIPTGGGKTRTAMEIVSNFFNSGLNRGEARQVVWIADKDELCEQAIDALESVWPHVGKKNLMLYRLWGKNNIESFDDFSFIVATYAKLNSIRKRGGTLPRPHLVIGDEAHNVIAPMHRTVLRSLEERDTRIYRPYGNTNSWTRFH